MAKTVLAAPGHAAATPIGELASAADTSEATVVRFCKKAGFSGYPSLRLALASEMGRGAASGRARALDDLDIAPEDSITDMVAKVAGADARAVSDTAKTIDIAALERAILAVGTAARIVVFGVGASGIVARDLEQKIERLGKQIKAHTDVHSAVMAASLLGPGDVAFGISHTGETPDTVEPFALAADQGAATIAITNYAKSALANRADIVLLTVAPESELRSGAMSSRVAQLSIVDFLCIGLVRAAPEEARAALARTKAAVAGRLGGGARRRMLSA